MAAIWAWKVCNGLVGPWERRKWGGQRWKRLSIQQGWRRERGFGRGNRRPRRWLKRTAFQFKDAGQKIRLALFPTSTLELPCLQMILEGTLLSGSLLLGLLKLRLHELKAGSDGGFIFLTDASIRDWSLSTAAVKASNHSDMGMSTLQWWWG
ncbi:hypothetical protein BC829DRAFT_415417 [Chytridium lagenaria]|nr:hypothetical protein BC829DRAFT_415417 [Chytridium lagenaria]